MNAQESKENIMNEKKPQPATMITKEEIRDWLLAHCVDEDGDLDLSDLDFSDFDGNVDISGMKVQKELWQNYQIVGGNLIQNNQVVYGELWQNNCVIGGNLYQHSQEVDYNINQSFQKAEGDILQDKSKARGRVVND